MCAEARPARGLPVAFPLLPPIAYPVCLRGGSPRIGEQGPRRWTGLLLGGADLDRVGGLAGLWGRPVDEQPLAGGQDAHVVPAQQAVGADVVAPRDAVERLPLAYDVDRSAAPAWRDDRLAEHRRQRLRARGRALQGEQQLESRSDLGLGVDAVRELELGHGDPVPDRKLVQGIAVLHRVRLPRGQGRVDTVHKLAVRHGVAEPDRKLVQGIDQPLTSWQAYTMKHGD